VRSGKTLEKRKKRLKRRLKGNCRFRKKYWRRIEHRGLIFFFFFESRRKKENLKGEKKKSTEGKKKCGNTTEGG